MQPVQENKRKRQVQSIGKVVFILGLILALGSYMTGFLEGFFAYMGGYHTDPSNYAAYSIIIALGLLLVAAGLLMMFFSAILKDDTYWVFKMSPFIR